MSSQSPGHEKTLAPRVFHFNRHAIASGVFDLKHHSIDQALAAKVFNLDHHTINRVPAPRLVHLNRHNLAPRIFHLNHHVIDSFARPKDFSANCDKDAAARATSAAQSCTLRSGLYSKPGAPGLPRSLCGVRDRQAGSSSRDSFAGMLAEPTSRRCDEDSSLAIEESSSCTRNSQVCAFGIADPEAWSGVGPKKLMPIRCRGR